MDSENIYNISMKSIFRFLILVVGLLFLLLRVFLVIFKQRLEVLFVNV